jgi:aminoglycoside phosphotransferase (APT) family kinase protein
MKRFMRTAFPRRLVTNLRRVKLIAEGRASEILDLGDGTVLRRFKAGGSPEREALVMRHALDAGYPVPRVLEVRPDALVLELIEGRSMLAEVFRRRSTVRQNADLLAGLHEQLHEIPAPPELAGLGPGDRLLHLDLHPENVMLAPSGPVVIDWTNARRGEPALDVALTWVILETSGGGALAEAFVRRFLAHFDRAEVVGALPAAADYRLADVNVRDDERARVRGIVERVKKDRKKFV